MQVLVPFSCSRKIVFGTSLPAAMDSILGHCFFTLFEFNLEVRLEFSRISTGEMVDFQFYARYAAADEKS